MTYTTIKEKDRLKFLPSRVTRYLDFETACFNVAGQLSAEYRGAYWKFCTTDNGAWFIYPDCATPYPVNSDMNGFEGALTAPEFGMGITLIVTSHMSFNEPHGEKLITNHGLLLDYVHEHGSSNLLQLID
jgi:Antirestriction protein